MSILCVDVRFFSQISPLLIIVTLTVFMPIITKYSFWDMDQQGFDNCRKTIIGKNTVKVTIIAKFQNFQLFFDAKTTNQKSK